MQKMTSFSSDFQTLIKRLFIFYLFYNQLSMSLKTVLEELQFTLFTPCIVFLWTWWGSPQPDPVTWVSRIESKQLIFAKANMRRTRETVRWALLPSIQQAWSTEVRWFSHLFCFSFLLNGIHFSMDWKLHVSEEGFPLPVECILLHLTCTCKCILDMPYWVEALLLAV